MTSSLASKLQIKPGARLAVLNAPGGVPPTFAAELPGIEVREGAEGTTDIVLLFVRCLADVGRLLAGAIAAAPAGGPLWIAYPKLTSGVASDLSRDILWRAVEPSGWRPVRQVALDEVWSAMRFKPM